MAKTNQETANPFVTSPAFSSVVIQHHLKSLAQPLNYWRSTQQLPPVLLLSGPSGIGKRWMTSFIAQWIFCTESGFNASSSSGADSSGISPCGECLSCKKMIHGTEVNFSVIQSDVDEETSRASTNSLKIDQFRKLKSSQGFGAHQGQYRITVIPDAERMTTQAANSILKLLEEPPRGWIFFITCADSALLLPTLVSRCQVLRLKPFTSNDIQKLLISTETPPERAEMCAQLSQGSWNRATTFANEAIWKQRAVLFDFLTQPIQEFHGLMDWAAEEPTHFDILTDLLEQFTADLIRWSVSPFITHPENFNWIHSDGSKSFCSHVKKVVKAQGSLDHAQAFWFSRAERMAQVREEALAPLNRKILLQDLLLPWIGALELDLS